MTNSLCSTLIAAAALLCAGLSTTSTHANHPNIVIILVDDMGYGDPGCFNEQSKISTPNIDSLARDGMRFTDAHAPGPLCHMSRYGLLTGRYPFRTDVTLWPTQPLIEPGQMTIATLAKSQGYRTAMVGKWHAGFKEEGYDKPLPGGPVDCGFDSFFGMRASTDIPPYFYIRGDRAVQPPTDFIEEEFSGNWSRIQGRRRLAGGIAPDMNLEDVLPRFTDEAVQVIEDHSQEARKADQPLMLYLAYPAPHTPWLPSAEFAGKSGAGMYGDFVMMVDAQIGRVLASLREADMEENTLVVFTSDNGPCWYDEDVERLGHDSAGGLRGMKSDAWEGGHRMPFIARWPGRAKEGSTSEQIVCFTDLLATFASIMNVELPADAGPDSFDFLPVLTGQPTPGTPIRTQFVMRAGSLPSMMTIRSGDWKLITQLGSGGFSSPKLIKPKPGGPEGQLYNMTDDLGETENLYLQKPDIVARLTAELNKIVEDGHSRAAAVRHGMDYLPVVFPGFSWHHQKGDVLNKIPRRKGQFFWSQITAAKRAGADMIYVAMFDEVDEGTAIFKCTNQPPTGDGVPFVTYEGLPSDYYLRLAGAAGKLLRDELPPSESIPVKGQDH